MTERSYHNELASIQGENLRLTDTLKRMRKGLGEHGQVGAVRELITSPEQAPVVAHELRSLVNNRQHFKLHDTDVIEIERLITILSNPPRVADCLKRNWAHDNPKPQQQSR